MLTYLLAALVLGLLIRGILLARPRTPVAGGRRHRVPARLTPEQARARAARLGWDRLLDAGRLRLVGAPVPDPGNPGAVLRLVEDPTGALGQVRVLLATNGTPDPDGTRALVGIPVPAHLGGPLAAAAWTYDDPAHPVRTTPATYARTARRA